MRWVGLTSAAVGALVLSGVASAAHAQTKAPAADKAAAARDAYSLNQTQGRQVLEIEPGARLVLKLDMGQPVTRNAQLKDYEAGAFYKLTPGFSLGGAIGLADKKPPEQQAKKEQVTPRVKVGAALKF